MSTLDIVCMENLLLFGICQIDDFMVPFVDLIRVSDINSL